MWFICGEELTQKAQSLYLNPVQHTHKKDLSSVAVGSDSEVACGLDYHRDITLNSLFGIMWQLLESVFCCW
jgi:hypothetical protein